MDRPTAVAERILEGKGAAYGRWPQLDDQTALGTSQRQNQIRFPEHLLRQTASLEGDVLDAAVPEQHRHRFGDGMTDERVRAGGCNAHRRPELAGEQPLDGW